MYAVLSHSLCKKSNCQFGIHLRLAHQNSKWAKLCYCQYRSASHVLCDNSCGCASILKSSLLVIVFIRFCRKIPLYWQNSLNWERKRPRFWDLRIMPRLFMTWGWRNLPATWKIFLPALHVSKWSLLCNYSTWICVVRKKFLHAWWSSLYNHFSNRQILYMSSLLWFV